MFFLGQIDYNREREREKNLIMSFLTLLTGGKKSLEKPQQGNVFMSWLYPLAEEN